MVEHLRLFEKQSQIDYPLSSLCVLSNLIQGDRPRPDDQIQVGEDWLILAELHEKPWLKSLLRDLEYSIRQGAKQRAEHLIERLLKYSGETDEQTIMLTRFFQGYLFAVDAAQSQDHKAETAFRDALGCSACQGAAQNNLGVVLARMGGPNLSEAVAQLHSALLNNPYMITAACSLRNLARTMQAEGAPNLPAEEPWSKIEAFAKKFQDDFANEHERIERFVHSTRFPTYHVLLIFERKHSFPPLSTGMPREDTYEPAARHLVQHGNRLLRDGRYGRAREVALRAKQRSTSAQPEADQTAKTAGLLQAEDDNLLRERQYLALIEEFDRALDRMTIERIDDPQSQLVELKPYVEDLSPHVEQWKRRAADVIRQQMTRTEDDTERLRLLVMLSEFLEAGESDVVLEAARNLKAKPIMIQFRADLAAGDFSAAHRRLADINKILGCVPEGAKRTLEVLQALHDSTPMDE